MIANRIKWRSQRAEKSRLTPQTLVAQTSRRSICSGYCMRLETLRLNLKNLAASNIALFERPISHTKILLSSLFSIIYQSHASNAFELPAALLRLTE